MVTAKRIALMLVGLFLVGGLLVAQMTNCKIIGTVTDNEGNPLPGVAVTATSPRLVGRTTAVTDENGTYRLLNLAPGVYKVMYALEGFQTLIRENISLTVEQTITLKVGMQIGKIQESITVTAQVPLIDVKSTAKGMTLTKEVFQTLPKGRNFDSLITAIPGVANDPLIGGTSIDGASGLENTYYVDGAEVTNIVRGSNGQSVNFDFVDEVQVKASGYQAEFGGSLGGVINVVTRSGGNQFHGEVLAYYSGSPLRAKYGDTLNLDLTDTKKAVYYSDEYLIGKDKDSRFEGGLNLGGYIFKDKLWFFGSFQPVYYTDTRTVNHYNGVAADWKRTEQYWNFQGKLTSQPFKNLRISASVVNNFWKYKGDLATRTSSPTPLISFDNIGYSYPNISGNVSADLTLGKDAMVSVRGNYFRTNTSNPLITPPSARYRFMTEAPGGYFGTTNIGLLDVPASLQRPTGFDSLPSGTQQINAQINERYSVNADLTYFLSLAGEHSFKVGGQFVRQGQNYDNTGVFPYVFLAWNRDFIAYGTDYGRGTYGYYAVRGNSQTGPYGDFYKAFSNRWNMYAQDSWTIGNRLTLNLGVRAESEYIPSYATGNPDFESLKPITFPFGKKIAPRLGFVYDVSGDSSLKVFGSFGYFFDVMKLYMAAGSFGGFKWKSAYYALDTYQWDQIGVNGNFPGRLLYTGDSSHTLDFRVPSFDSVDPSLKPMSQQEISLGVEKKLREDLSVSVRGIQKHLRYAIEDVGVLTPEGESYYTTNPGYGYSRLIKNGGQFDNAFPETPKAKREYWGLNISLEKRFSNNWMGGISYTLSRLSGNYNGLASGDESGRTDPNVERYFDLWYLAYDQSLKKIDGPLIGDHTHFIKAYGSYSFPFGLTLGTVVNAYSGQPTSTEYAMDVQGYMPFNRGDLGRSPFTVFANLYAEYNLKMGKDVLSFSVNVDNITDCRTAQRIYQIYNQGSVALTDATLLAGNWNIANYNPVLDPRFKMLESFYGSRQGGLYFGTPLQARLGLKFAF